MARDTTVLVLGGGSTGTGIARDLARRGVDVTLLEQGNLTHGTTGRMHGLLHSGGRYAVSDRASAEECIAENRVLRDVAAHCVEDTGGLFVKQPADSEAYFEEKLAACRDCGIDAQVLSGREARDVEPYLARDVEKAIAVPDAAVDPFRLVVANAVDAREHGARVETHSEVVDVLVADDLASDGTATASPTGDGKSAGAPEDAGTVVGVEVEHAAGAGPRVHGARGERETITAEYVVNATGPWAGEVAALAGVDVAVRPSKGAMTVMNVRQVDTVVNRCRPKGDADIVVPHETTAILGTTDVAVDDPTAYAETRAEVDRLVDELAEVVPILADARSIRSFWGVRPLYEPPDVGSEDSTDVTRDFFVLDHADRDGLDGFLTVVGGKFTTYRAMAEAVSDRVCDALGVTAACSTAEESLPGSEDPGRLDAAMDDYGLRSPIARRSRDRLGSRADAVLDVDGPNPVVCECEAVTTAEVADAIDGCGSDLNAVRIRTRATMGNCQGGLCCHRVANVLATDYPEPTVRAAWSELLEERWRGHRHALWGEQLSQAALNHFLHATTMNLDHDPAGGGADGSRGGGSEAAGDPRRSVTIDYAAFDAGPGREHGRTDGDQRADRDAHRGTDGGA